MAIGLSVNYLQNRLTDFDEILHTAYWLGEEASYRFPTTDAPPSGEF